MALLWGSAAGCLTGETKEMSTSTEREEQPQWSQALVLIGDFNQPNICWRNNTAEHRQSRRFLECLDEYFFLQVIDEPVRRSAMVDLILTNEERACGEYEAQGLQ